MTREKLFPSLVLACAFAMPLIGCGGGGEETPEPTENGATPTEEPTPTAAPLNNWQAFTMLQISDEGNGVDVDGDNSADNGIYAAFETIEETLVATTDAIIQNLNEDNEDAACHDNDSCIFTNVTAKTISETLTNVIEEAISVDNINESLARPYDQGNAPYALNLKEEGSGHGLYYFTGERYGDSYTAEVEVGYQSGSLESGDFGPGTFEFSFVLGEQGQDPTEVSFAIEDAITEISSFSEESISDAYTGGGLKIVELMAVVEPVVVAIDDALEQAGIEFDGDAILTAVEEALIATSDIKCSDGTECFSISLSYDASEVETPKN